MPLYGFDENGQAYRALDYVQKLKRPRLTKVRDRVLLVTRHRSETHRRSGYLRTYMTQFRLPCCGKTGKKYRLFNEVGMFHAVLCTVRPDLIQILAGWQAIRRSG